VRSEREYQPWALNVNLPLQKPLTSSDKRRIAGAREPPYCTCSGAKSHEKVRKEAIACIDTGVAKYRKQLSPGWAFEVFALSRE